jgi:anaerobic dimethyl sulfoxide reductase subunit B (iron-sulfur subunit)
MKQLGFYIDSSKCTGCKTCQISCKDLHNHQVGVNFRRVYEYAGGNWRQEGKAWRQQVFAYYVSVACNHCANPVCVKVCEPKALTKRSDNGLVILDEAQCTACKACAQACPYGAPQFDENRKKMTKCDACFDRVIAGGKPVCVESCPQRAIDFGELEQLKNKYPVGQHIAPLPDPSWTTPSLLVHSGHTARPVGDKKGSVQNPKEV